jgi:hypothetical protein
MYLLGSFGHDRRQLQVVNRYDSCCFAGVKWQTYADVIRECSRALGAGEWDLYMDESHAGHIISPVTRARILSELGGTSL